MPSAGVELPFSLAINMVRRRFKTWRPPADLMGLSLLAEKDLVQKLCVCVCVLVHVCILVCLQHTLAGGRFVSWQHVPWEHLGKGCLKGHSLGQ